MTLNSSSPFIGSSDFVRVRLWFPILLKNWMPLVEYVKGWSLVVRMRTSFVKNLLICYHVGG